MRDRVGDEPVDLLGLHHAAGDQRRDALDRGEQDETDALGLAGLQGALGLPLRDQLEQHPEGALGGLVQRAGRLAVLAREHQLEQCRVVRREADIGGSGRLQARLEALARAVDGAPQLGAEAREAGLGKRVEQRPAVGEVPPRRAVADAGVARELAQRQRLHAALAHGALGLLEQRGAEVAVVVGALAHPARSLTDTSCH